MRVAIVCDWLVGTGGAERVVLELHKMFPDAPIYTSQYNPNPKVWYDDKWFVDADIKTGWLSTLPLDLRKFLPLFRAIYFSRLDLSGYDLVISSSGAEAKFIKVKTPAVHITYCHAPTHYYWARYEQYLKNPGFGWLDPLARLGLRLLVGPMRTWDKRAAKRPDFFIANSNFTKQQVKKYYGRESEVIHPPVDIERFKPNPAGERHGFLAAGRQTPYKKIHLAVEACTKLGLPLTVIGTGPDHQRLVKLAGPTVNFITAATDETLARHMASAEAFIFPGVDDFGVVAVEALAAGTPVVAYGKGGALDYVSKTTGLTFTEPTVDGLVSALTKFNKENFSPRLIRLFAARFSPEAFQKAMRAFIIRSS